MPFAPAWNQGTAVPSRAQVSLRDPLCAPCPAQGLCLGKVASFCPQPSFWLLGQLLRLPGAAQSCSIPVSMVPLKHPIPAASL